MLWAKSPFSLVFQDGWRWVRQLLTKTNPLFSWVGKRMRNFHAMPKVLHARKACRVWECQSKKMRVLYKWGQGRLFPPLSWILSHCAIIAWTTRFQLSHNPTSITLNLIISPIHVGHKVCPGDMLYVQYSTSRSVCAARRDFLQSITNNHGDNWHWIAWLLTLMALTFFLI